jgi:hypothetical protein
MEVVEVETIAQVRRFWLGELLTLSDQTSEVEATQLSGQLVRLASMIAEKHSSNQFLLDDFLQKIKCAEAQAKRNIALARELAAETKENLRSA